MVAGLSPDWSQVGGVKRQLESAQSVPGSGRWNNLCGALELWGSLACSQQNCPWFRSRLRKKRRVGDHPRSLADTMFPVSQLEKGKREAGLGTAAPVRPLCR